MRYGRRSATYYERSSLMGSRRVRRAAVAALAAAAMVAAGSADLGDVDTPADVIHPDIHDKVGDGSNANPNGQSPAGGGEIHGIGNVPGQSDADPANGDPGFADQLETVHGGIGEYNPNAGS